LALNPGIRQKKNILRTKTIFFQHDGRTRSYLLGRE
jgi:hypothetical protein